MANNAQDGVSCWACGAGLPLPARFCSSCGARVDAAARRAEDAGGSQPCERRQLTVMFCDLAGSTKLSLELDPEDFTSIIRAYRDVCAQIARSWKGYVSRNIGDGVLVYFGYPQASEDDAFRGVAAAWELSRAIPKLDLSQHFVDEARVRAHAGLEVRVSLHTGLAVVGDVVGRYSAESHDVLGAAPNIAAKLQALARPGEVVVSETTAALLPPTIETRPLKTTASPAGVRAFVIANVPPQQVRPRATGADLFVGRSTALERMLAHAHNREDEASGLLLVGEPGVGKSRLVQEMVKRCSDTFPTWTELACSPYEETSPLHPFSRWLRSGEMQADPKSDGKTGVAAPLLTSPFDHRRRMFGHLKSKIFSQGPRVGLVLEDMHWADSTTADFVTELVTEANPRSFLMVMTSRWPLRGPLATSRRLHVETLTRLDPGDAAALARALSVNRPLSAFEIAEIVDRAGGVPLFIEQFVKAKTGYSQIDDGSTHDQIPTTLRDALMGVLDKLGVGRAIALSASVFGRRFRYSQLRSLLEIGDADLGPALTALKEANILVQKDDAADPSFEFHHALLRDTAYQTLLRSERERLHLRLANLVETAGSSSQEATPELLAMHYSLGSNYRRAIDHWLVAASEATKRSANAEALSHLKRGLEDCRGLAKLKESEAVTLELELLRKLSAPLVAVSGWSSPDLEKIYARAAVLCKLTKSPDAEFEFARGSYNLHLLRSEVRTADAFADRMLGMAQHTRDPDKHRAYLLEASRSKSLAAFYAGRYGEARSLLDQMLSLYDATKHASHAFYYGTEPAVMAQSYLAWMDAIEGQAESSRRRIEDALARARNVGHAFSLCYGLCFAASCAQLSNRAEEAATQADEAIRLANHHNFQYWLAWGHALLGWVKGLGTPREGIDLIDAACDSYRATGSSLVIPYFQALACQVARSAGLEEFAAREAELRHRATETGVRFWEVVLPPASGV
jgi:class 3 adenylate cyclase/tetratricopeptide (TPR) repeat protein